MKNRANSFTLFYSCEACGVRLGVNRSLAGTVSPCPKCGEPVRAPEVKDSSATPNSVITRTIVPGEKRERASMETFRKMKVVTSRHSVTSNPSEKENPSRRRSSGARRGPRPGSEVLDLRALSRAAFVISVVAAIVLSVVWFLKNQ